MKAKILAYALPALILAIIHLAEAQQPKKVPRIGMLLATTLADPSVDVLRESLRDFGYVEGKNIVLEHRFADGKLGRFPDLAAELVRSRVDAIVAVNEAGARAAKNATKTIPIVMVNVGPDPVDAGLVESFARPGGNVTGVTLMAVEITAKRLELFKESVPKLVRVVALYDPANRGNVAEAKEVETVARSLGLTGQSKEIQSREGFEKVFAALTKQRSVGLYVPGGPLFSTNRKLIVDFALKSRMPVVYVRREFVDDGGLMSYGADSVEQYRRAAYFVDRILKGTKPADLPVERPTKFEFVINLKAAKQIGLTIPPNVLARADKVIK
jgi:putative ABC transport system substrate-binding protein